MESICLRLQHVAPHCNFRVGKSRQEDHRFKGSLSLGYFVRHCLKKTKINKKQDKCTQRRSWGLENNLGGEKFCLEIFKLSNIVFIPLTLAGIYKVVYFNFLFVSLVKKKKIGGGSVGFKLRALHMLTTDL